MSLRRLVLALLPFGAYSRAPDAQHVLELGAWATGLDTADSRITAALAEVFPPTATSTLARWEALLGLVPASTDTTAQRRAAILAALRVRPSLSPGYLVEVIGTLTGCTVTVTEFTPLFYGVAEYGDVYVDEYVFRFLVVIDKAEATAAAVQWDRVQLVVEDIEPAHTAGIVCFTDARYDDAYSPYDHCVYGA